jgi:hypothetical protein
MRLPSSPEELLSYLDKRLEEIEDGQPITDRKAVKQVALKLIKQGEGRTKKNEEE